MLFQDWLLFDDSQRSSFPIFYFEKKVGFKLRVWHLKLWCLHHLRESGCLLYLIHWYYFVSLEYHWLKSSHVILKRIYSFGHHIIVLWHEGITAYWLKLILLYPKPLYTFSRLLEYLHETPIYLLLTSEFLLIFPSILSKKHVSLAVSPFSEILRHSFECLPLPFTSPISVCLEN